LGFEAKGISGRTIAEFFRSYSTHPRLNRTHAGRISDFIAAQQNNGELTDWTVVFRSSQATNANNYSIGELPLKVFVRTNTAGEGEDQVHVIPSSHVISGKDESLDFTNDEYAHLLEHTKKRYRDGLSRAKSEPDVAAGDIVRQHRPLSRGLMLVYLIGDSGPDPLSPTGGLPLPAVALSFPKNPNSIPVEYQVGEVWWQQEMSL